MRLQPLPKVAFLQTELPQCDGSAAGGCGNFPDTWEAGKDATACSAPTKKMRPSSVYKLFTKAASAGYRVGYLVAPPGKWDKSHSSVIGIQRPIDAKPEHGR